MKHYVLLHNLIVNARATLAQSVESWTPTEVETIMNDFRQMIKVQHCRGGLTTYQRNKLLELIDSIAVK